MARDSIESIEGENFKGPIFALLTPFNVNGDVDFGALHAYLDFLRHHGVENILVNGTTGEFASLTLQERKAVLKFCRSQFTGTIINHISSPCLRDCLELLDHAGGYADGVLILPPYYYADVTAEGVLLFFQECLRKSTRPVFLYNFPRHTQVVITSGMLLNLTERYGNLYGIKDSSGDLGTAESFKSTVPGIKVFFGSDRLALAALVSGLDGAVSGAGNPVPEWLVHLQRSFDKGGLDAAQAVQQGFNVWNDFRKAIKANGIALAKTALSARIEGFPVHVRSPLLPVDPREEAVIKERLITDILPLIVALPGHS